MNYPWKRQPRKHQLEALEACRGKKVFAFLMAMRCVDAETEYLSPNGWRRKIGRAHV